MCFSSSCTCLTRYDQHDATPVFHVCRCQQQSLDRVSRFVINSNERVSRLSSLATVARVSTLANNKQRPCLIRVIASYSRTCLTRCEQPATPLFDSVPWPQLYQHHAVLLSLATGLYVGPTLVLVSIIRFTLCRLKQGALWCQRNSFHFSM